MEPRANRRQRPRKDATPSGLTTPRAAGVAGIMFAVLFIASVLAIRSFVEPESTGLLATVGDVVGDDVSFVPAYLVPFSGIAFLWFVGAVRDRIGIYEDRFFASVFLGSAVVFVAMLFAAGSVVAGLLTLAEPTSATTALGQSIARGMFYLYGAKSAGVFTLVASMIILRIGAASRWAALVGLAIGAVLLLSGDLFDMAILLFPVWVALISILILVQVPERATPQG